MVSELPPGEHPTRSRFLTRNRVIAALTAGTVVVEAALRSGARRTVSDAHSLQRVVMAVPGPVTSPMSAGCHAELRDRGAIAVTSADEVIASVGPIGQLELEPRPGAGAVRPLDGLDPDTLRVLDALRPERPRGLAAVAAEALLPPADVAAHLGLLTVLGHAERLGGDGAPRWTSGRDGARRCLTGPRLAGTVSAVGDTGQGDAPRIGAPAAHPAEPPPELPAALAGLLAAFEGHLRDERSLSPHSIRAYLGDARSLLAHAARSGVRTPDELTLAHLRSWLALQTARGSARSTVARRAAGARALTAFALRCGLSAADPALLLASPKAHRTLPAVLRADQAAAVLDAAQARAAPGRRPRRRAPCRTAAPRRRRWPSATTRSSRCSMRAGCG